MPKVSGKLKIVNFEGELVIDRVQKLKDELQKALDSAKKVIIKFNNVEKMDLSIIQIILAANLYAKKNKRKLEFTGTLSEAIISAFFLCGLIRTVPENMTELVGCLVEEVEWNN